MMESVKMSLLSTRKGYGNLSVALHWIISPIILFMLGLGYFMARLPKASEAAILPWYQLHKSLGLTVLFIIIFRLLVKLLGRRPDWQEHMPRWQQILATLTHTSLYLCMFFMPMSGLFMSSAAGKSPKFWGWFTVALPVPQSDTLAFIGYNIHFFCAWGFAALICLHIFALLHHRWHGMPSLSRMWFTKAKED